MDTDRIRNFQDTRSGRMRSWRILGAVVALSLLAACANEASTSTEEATTGAATDSASRAAGTGEPAALRIAIGAGPTNMDFVIKTDAQRDAFGFGNVYETLTEHRSGDMELVPGLATEWSSDGETAWTFTLRDDVTFSNGDQFGADDVVATIETILNDDSGAEQNKGTIDTVESVSAVDGHTVEFVTSAPDPSLPARLSLIGIASADTTAEQRTEQLIGTGPYEQVVWEKDDSITLAARDDYWGEQPKWDEVKVIFRPEASVRLAALQSGEVDLVQDLSPELAGAAPVVSSAPQSVVAILRFNARNGPLTDPRLREAVNYAVDRQALVDNVFGGYATLPKAQPITVNAFGADDSMEDFPYDADKARALVDEVGGDVTLTFSGSAGRSLKDREAGEAVVAMLEDVGFTVEPEFPAVDRWVDQIFAADFGGPDLIYVAHGNEVLDPAFTAGLYFACDGEVSRFCDETSDELIEEAGTSMNPDQRAETYSELWRQLKDQAAFAALANLNSVWGASEDTQWQPREDGFMRFDEMTAS